LPRDLLGKENRTHAARAQLAHQPEAARKARSELGVNLSHSGKPSARQRSGGFTPPHGDVEASLSHHMAA
jgi:hypothetical protein